MLTTRLCSFVLALGIATAAGAAFASPAAAWSKNDRAIYNERQTWFLVDRNRDGRISDKEWAFARDHGYDKLQGVPKKRLSRGEYQAYLSEYIDRNRSFGKKSWWKGANNGHGAWNGHGASNGQKKNKGSTWNQGVWNPGRQLGQGHDGYAHDGQGHHGQGPWYVSPGGVQPWSYGLRPGEPRGGHRAR